MISDLEVTSIDLSHIFFSPDNPRKSETGKKGAAVAADLQELADSIKEVGVLQPILVRVLDAAETYENNRKQGFTGPRDGKSKYEIIAGARRFSAAALAGLTKIPARIIDGDEKTIAAIRLVENLQRKDLNPIEEAAAYKKLADDFGYSAEEIAKSAAKSVAYVRQRFKLVDLPAAAVKAVREGKISPALGLLIARIPSAKLRENATKQILSPHHYYDEKPEAMSYQQAQRLVEQQFMTLLSKAPFPTDDASLVPEAGSCLACPKRTGQQADLFSDVAKDSCTDLACFDRKKKAHCQRSLDTAAASGQKILSPDDFQKHFPYGHLRDNSKYLDLSEQNWRANGRAYKQILGKEVPEITIAVNPEDGRLVELVHRAEALAIAKKLNPKLVSDSNQRASSEAANTRRRIKILQEAGQRAITQVVERAAERLPDLPFWRILLEAACDRFGFETCTRLVNRRGWADEKKRTYTSPRPESIIRKQTADVKNWRELSVILVELICQGGASYQSYHLSHGEHFKALAGYYGVNLKKIEKQVAEEKKKLKKSKAGKSRSAISK